MRVGVIGAGNMGRHHVRIWSEISLSNPNVKLVGVSDFNPEVKKLAKRFNCAYFDDYKKMVDVLKVEAVSVCVPTQFHAPVVDFLLRRNIHVLVEKPIAATLEEARQLVKLAKEQPSILMVGHIEWFNPVIQELNHVLRSGLLGEPRMIDAERLGNRTAEPDINVITDIGVHDIHLINKLLGEYPIEICAYGGKSRFLNQEDYAVIQLSYVKSVASIRLAWIYPNKTRHLAIIGSKGAARVDYIDQKLRVYMLEEDRQVSPDFGTFAEFLMLSNDFANEGCPIKIPNRGSEPLRLEIEAFVAACSGKIENPIPPEEALAALEICLAATAILRKEEK